MDLRTAGATWLALNVVEQALAVKDRWRNSCGTDHIEIRVKPRNDRTVAFDFEASGPLKDSEEAIRLSRSEFRFETMRDVVFHIARISHHNAASLLAEHAEKGKPIGLYLRSFDLSSQILHINDPTLKLSPTDEVATVQSYRDGEFQRKVLAAVDLPLVGISNRQITSSAGSRLEPDSIGVPKLIVRDPFWLDVARGLISFCKPIVVFLGSPSLGLLRELKEIQLAGKAECTVIVDAYSVDADTRCLEGLVRQELTPSQLEEWLALTAHFPNRINCDCTEAELRRAWQTARTVSSRRGPPRSPLMIPSDFGPPTEIANAISEQANELYHQAGTSLHSGDLLASEDLLYDSLVGAILSNDRQLTALGFLLLSTITASLGRRRQAVEAALWTVALAETIGWTELQLEGNNALRRAHQISQHT